MDSIMDCEEVLMPNWRDSHDDRECRPSAPIMAGSAGGRSRTELRFRRAGLALPVMVVKRAG